MEIRNNTPANLCVQAVSHPDTKAEAAQLVVPGDGQLYVNDTQWKNHYADECDKLLAAGHLEVVVDAEESDEEIIAREQKELDDALALIAKHEASKPAAPVAPAKTATPATPKKD